MKTEEIMKDSTYNCKLNERDNGHLSDISDKNSKMHINADECKYLQITLLNFLFAPAPERAPSHPAVHLRLSRAGG